MTRSPTTNDVYKVDVDTLLSESSRESLIVAKIGVSQEYLKPSGRKETSNEQRRSDFCIASAAALRAATQLCSSRVIIKDGIFYKNMLADALPR